MNRKITHAVFVTSLFTLILFAGMSNPAAAWNTYWQHDPLTPGSWHIPENWTNGIPISSDYAYIDNGGTAQIAADTFSRSLYLGEDDFGAVEQASGANTVDGNLCLGLNFGSSGTYNLSEGQLSADREYIGHKGTGEFNQTGGTNTINSSLRLGCGSGSSGTYNLSGGQLSAYHELISDYSTGEFNQTGGTNTINSYLYLGYESGSSGTYNLSGTGQLSAGSEYIGYEGTGEFNQSGGTNTMGYLSVKDDSSYTLSGGILSIGDSAEIRGSFHFEDSNWTLNIEGGLADFSNAIMDGAGSASFSSAENTLTIFPSGFNPVGEFGSYNVSGLVHTTGAPLIIHASEGFAGRGWIGDHVQNHGTIVASSGPLEFRGGLTISEGGTVDFGFYNLKVNDGQTVTIAASSGQLSARCEYIGYSGTGEFNQTGGINTIVGTGQYDLNGLYLGYAPGSSGTYNLSAGELSAAEECIGFNNGTGEFNQTGGVNTIVGGTGWCAGLRLGSGSSYNLSGTGQLTASREYIGFIGAGEFNQTGGTTNTITWDLYLGYSSGSNGTYNLSAGQLSVYGDEHIGYWGTGEFNQNGGTHTVGDNLYLGYYYYSGSSRTYNLSGGSLAVGDLDINYGWMDIDISEIDAFTVSGDKVGLLDGYILDGKIFDSTLDPDNYLYAIYDSDNDWTTLGIGVIPEPATIIMFGIGLFGLAEALRRGRRTGTTDGHR